MEPKWSQNRTQDGPKSKIKTRSKKDDLKDRLGAVLGRSWVVLGAVLGSCLMVLYWFLYYFVEINVVEQNGFKRRLGPILGRFGWPRGSKMKAKEGQKVR